MRLGGGRCCIFMCISLMCKSFKSPIPFDPSLLVTTQSFPLPLLPSLRLHHTLVPHFPLSHSTIPLSIILPPSLFVTNALRTGLESIMILKE
jgi:hypothetical protein